MKCSFGQNNRGQKCVFHVFLLYSVVMFCSDWNCLIFCCLLLRKRDPQRVKDTCHETLPFSFFFFFLNMCSWCSLRKCIASTKFQKRGSKLILHITIPFNWWRHMWSKVSQPFHSEVCPSTTSFEKASIFSWISFLKSCVGKLTVWGP